jgi:3-oxoacid CoA-transferase subunit A
MYYLTGDIHGDVRRLLNDFKRYDIQSTDTVILLGDVGLNYYGSDRGDNKSKKFLNKQGVTVFCIHGNHEMRPETIASYEETKWNGGVVYYEPAYPNLLFAKDGEVFDLDGYRVVVIGGAYSVDKFYRLQRGMSWFDDEQPSAETKARVEHNLDAVGWMVDCVLSHTCPARYTPTEAFLSGLDQSSVDRSTEEWLDSIEERLCYGSWFCGHWHIEKHIDKMYFLMKSYEALAPLEDYTIPVDEQTFRDFTALCERKHTSVDIVTRAMFRYFIDPKNRETIKRWADEFRERECSENE